MEGTLLARRSSGAVVISRHLKALSLILGDLLFVRKPQYLLPRIYRKFISTLYNDSLSFYAFW